MKHYAVIQADKSILVKTPNPYIVDTYKDVNPVVLEDVRHKLSNATKFLYDCLRMLRITKKQAQQRNFTLNIFTGMALRDIALRSDFLSHAMKMTNMHYDW